MTMTTMSTIATMAHDDDPDDQDGAGGHARGERLGRVVAVRGLAQLGVVVVRVVLGVVVLVARDGGTFGRVRILVVVVEVVLVDDGGVVVEVEQVLSGRDGG